MSAATLLDKPGGVGYESKRPGFSAYAQILSRGQGGGGKKLEIRLESAASKGRTFGEGTVAETARRIASNDHLKESVYCWRHADNPTVWTKSYRKAWLYLEQVVRLDYGSQLDWGVPACHYIFAEYPARMEQYDTLKLDPRRSGCRWTTHQATSQNVVFAEWREIWWRDLSQASDTKMFD